MTLAVITERPSLDPRLMWAYVTLYDGYGRVISQPFKCGTSRQVSAWLGETLKGASIVEPVEIEFLRAINQ